MSTDTDISEYKLSDLIGSTFAFLSLEEKLRIVSGQGNIDAALISKSILNDPYAWRIGESDNVKTYFWDRKKSSELTKYVPLKAYDYGEALAQAILRNFPHTIENIISRVQSGKDILPGTFSKKIGKAMLILIRNKKNDDAMFFFEMGVNPNTVHAGISLLQEAVRSDNYDMAKYLLEHGASPTIEAEYNITPLDVARYNKYDHMIDLLSKYK